MGMTGPSKSNGGVMSEINVTPLVDVMLVLLIIFMVTAPLLKQGVKVDLPRARGEELKSDKEMPALTVTRDGRYFLGKYEIPAKDLEEKLAGNERIKREKRVNVYSDRDAPYGTVAAALAALHKAGVDQVGLVFENLSVHITSKGPEYIPVPKDTGSKGDKRKSKPGVSK
ncbi:MAG: biopolymer transporter ExbD [Deltaproteobacteria bacterium]|nr:biopolymer transporter ExbD [Deltaproteobacteria bacterium]